MTPTYPQIPARLHARWSHLPRLAALAQRRLGPPPVHPLTRPAARWMWLLALTTVHAGGRLLGHGSAIVSVTGPRQPWHRRAAYLTTFLLGVTLTSVWIWLPMQTASYAAAHHVPPPLACGAAVAVIAPLFLETGNMLWHARTAVPTTRTARHLRKTGSTWWEAGDLVAHEDDPVSAGRLVHTALAVADTQQIGLVAMPSNAATRRAYQRRGFIPGPLTPHVLIRPPAPTDPGPAR